MTNPILAFIVAAAVSLAIGPKAIELLAKLKLRQTINEDAPERHKGKQGTPMMGGLIILIGTLLGIATARLSDPKITAVLLLMLGFTALGFADDYLIASRGKSLGLKARHKLFAQFVMAIAFVIWVYGNRNIGATVIPLWGDNAFDLGWMYYPLAVLLIVGMSNAVNLADGLDGLVAGTTTILALTLGVLVVPAANYGLTTIAWALAGGCVGFLWYNSNPAKVFMGDTGSLAIGAAMAGIAIAGRREFLFLIAGLIFVFEALSVIIQVVSFKTTGKRVFKMTPIHHHFELSGWAEQKNSSQVLDCPGIDFSNCAFLGGNVEIMGLNEFSGKNAHIIGMARSGLAAAEILTSLGAAVTIHDQKDESSLGESLIHACEIDVETRVGNKAYDGIEEADLIISSPGVPETCPGLVAARAHGIPVLPEIELAYRVSKAPIIAVTGTNGKTTTTALIGEIFKHDGKQVYIAGNIIAGDIRMPLVKAAFNALENEIIVAEISSFQLEWITSFRPKVGALLNVSADHLDRHPDLETYARMKARLFEYQDPTDFAILNADDARVAKLASDIKSRVWMFSSTSEVELGTFARGTEVWIRTAAGEKLVCDTSKMKLRGKHNLENILAASAAALAFGANSASIQSAVDAFEAPEHRLEPVAEIGGVEFLNNSMCTNVAASVSSLEAIGRPAIVIAGGKDKGSDYGPLGEAFVKYAKHVVLIGKDAPLIERATRNAGFEKISNAGPMEEAVEMAWRQAESGDTVVLSPGCASFDMFNDFEHRGQVFKSAVHALAERVGVDK